MFKNAKKQTLEKSIAWRWMQGKHLFGTFHKLCYVFGIGLVKMYKIKWMCVKTGSHVIIWHYHW